MLSLDSSLVARLTPERQRQMDAVTDKIKSMFEFEPTPLDVARPLGLGRAMYEREVATNGQQYPSLLCSTQMEALETVRDLDQYARFRLHANYKNSLLTLYVDAGESLGPLGSIVRQAGYADLLRVRLVPS